MFTESFGLVVSAAGDINGDGFEDLAVADAEQGPYSGRTAVIYGKAGGPGDIDLSALTSDQGFSIFGVGPYDVSGRSISSAGDVNGDGIDDLLIGAPQADPGGREGAGEAYLIFGKAGGLGDINLATLTPDAGLKISGAGEYDATGASVRAAGDINGDGYADIIIGAPEFDAPGNGQGLCHLWRRPDRCCHSRGHRWRRHPDRKRSGRSLHRWSRQRSPRRRRRQGRVPWRRRRRRHRAGAGRRCARRWRERHRHGGGQRIRPGARLYRRPARPLPEHRNSESRISSTSTMSRSMPPASLT